MHSQAVLQASFFNPNVYISLKILFFETFPSRNIQYKITFKKRTTVTFFHCISFHVKKDFHTNSNKKVVLGPGQKTHLGTGILLIILHPGALS